MAIGDKGRGGFCGVEVGLFLGGGLLMLAPCWVEGRRALQRRLAPLMLSTGERRPLLRLWHHGTVLNTGSLLCYLF